MCIYNHDINDRNRECLVLSGICPQKMVMMIKTTVPPFGHENINIFVGPSLIITNISN